MIGAIQDITVRKRSEETILASEEKYRQIFYKNPYPTWIFELDTLRIVEVNDAAVEKYGFEKSEFYRLTMRDLHPSGEAELFVESIRSQEPEVNVERKLWHHGNKSGSIIIVEITPHRIDYFGKPCMQVIINDVTGADTARKRIGLTAAAQAAANNGGSIGCAGAGAV